MLTPLPISEHSKSEVNFKDQIFTYLIYWKWFLLSILICIITASIYLRYYVMEYGVNASILIKDEKKGGTSELSVFSDLNIFSGRSNVDNEIAIIKSGTLSQNTVKELDLDISYFSEGRVVNREIYSDIPYKVIFINKAKDYYEKDTVFTISKVDNKKFILSDANKNNKKLFLFGHIIHFPLGDFLVLNNNQKKNTGDVYCEEK